jgi:hypothetical protein
MLTSAFFPAIDLAKSYCGNIVVTILNLEFPPADERPEFVLPQAHIVQHRVIHSMAAVLSFIIFFVVLVNAAPPESVDIYKQMQREDTV